MTLTQLKKLLNKIIFRHHTWRTGRMGDGFYLQLRFHAPDTETGIEGWHHGGKFYVSRHVAFNELLRTAHKAVISAVLHEADEDFKVNGLAVYHPHISVPALIEAARNGHEYRKSPDAKDPHP